MKKVQVRLFLVLLVLTAASLACSIPTAEGNLLPSAVPLSTEEVQLLEDQIQETLVNPASNGEVQVTITEQQLQSFFIASMSAEQEQMISDPQVNLTQGQAEIYGKVTQSGISANTRIVLSPRIDENGNPRLEVVSINIGPFPVPDSMKSRVQTMTDNALSSYLASSSDRFSVTGIDISEDLITITGVQQQP